MQDTELYKQILGIAFPWEVIRVEFSHIENSVNVYVEHKKDASLKCPICGKDSPGYDSNERKWRHLDTCQYKTILISKCPRVNCNEHGVHTINTPWAEKGSRFSALFEALIIRWLHEATIKAVSDQFDLSWNAISNIMHRAVKRGIKKKVKCNIDAIAIDETSFQKRHEYVTVVTDATTGTVEWVSDNRDAESLRIYYDSLSNEQKTAIKSISMDMWRPYIRETKNNIPDADKKISFDKFHVAKKLNEGVDKVRRKEHRELLLKGNKLLKGTRFDWLKNDGQIDNRSRPAFNALVNMSLKTARAWAIKETAMGLWDYKYLGLAEKLWVKTINWMRRSRLEPMKKIALTLKKYLWGILNAMHHNVTNAISESINLKIQKVKRMACGFRNRERFKIAIMFHCGGLELYPEFTHTNR